MEAQRDRPSYVKFEVRQIEDRNATIAAGHYVGKDVNYALVTPAGSKDIIDRQADEWIASLELQARDSRIPPEWVEGYRMKYKAFCEGQEIPEDGTPILTWPAVSPAQQRLLLDARVRTVEDLATANETTLGMIGMGGRALKQRAQVWLETSKDIGQASATIEKLTVDNAGLKTRNADLEEKVTKMLLRLEALEKK